MHALHLPPRPLWRMGLLALGLTIALLVATALIAPTIADLSTPSATTVDRAASSAPSAPTWATDPLAPPSLLRAR
jgi:hypothetical protein